MILHVAGDNIIINVYFNVLNRFEPNGCKLGTYVYLIASLRIDVLESYRQVRIKIVD